MVAVGKVAYILTEEPFELFAFQDGHVTDTVRLHAHMPIFSMRHMSMATFPTLQALSESEVLVWFPPLAMARVFNLKSKDMRILSLQDP
jgi:hypothetical protein